MIRIVINKYNMHGESWVYEYLTEKSPAWGFKQTRWWVVPSYHTVVVKGNLFSTAQCLRSVHWMQGPEVYASAL